jgi:type I restriction enzyme S subunit
VRTVPLKRIVGINLHTLPETTEPGFEFRYVDIGAVGRGQLLSEPEATVFAAAPSRARRLVRQGDTIISTVRTYLRAVWPVRDSATDLVVSTGFAVLTPTGSIDSRYLGWLAQSDVVVEEVVARSVGVSYPAINPSDIGTVRVPLPPLARQRAIADYLDRETARIDALIDKKRRMIELLEEQTHAWSVRLVLGDLGGTKGSRSPSGLYRVVPDGWKETALRHLHCSVQTGPFGSQLHAEEYVEGGWPVVNPMNLVEGEISAVKTMTVSDQKRTELERHMIAPGDIVFGRRGAMGRAGLAEEAHRGWLCGTGSLRLRLRSTLITPTYLKLLLETPVARAYFELASVGSTMDNLNSEIVLALPTLVPPIATQDRIVEDVHARRETTEALRGRLERQIGLLQEHRQALITAAVTGELEIPGVAA